MPDLDSIWWRCPPTDFGGRLPTDLPRASPATRERQARSTVQNHRAQVAFIDLDNPRTADEAVMDPVSELRYSGCSAEWSRLMGSRVEVQLASRFSAWCEGELGSAV